MFLVTNENMGLCLYMYPVQTTLSTLQCTPQIQERGAQHFNQTSANILLNTVILSIHLLSKKEFADQIQILNFKKFNQVHLCVLLLSQSLVLSLSHTNSSNYMN